MKAIRRYITDQKLVKTTSARAAHQLATQLTTTRASDTQVGGDHYVQKPMQPWDYIAANGLDFFQGNVVKYVTRFRDKGGIDDLRKAAHYLEKLIELETAKAPKS